MSALLIKSFGVIIRLSSVLANSNLTRLASVLLICQSNEIKVPITGVTFSVLVMKPVKKLIIYPLDNVLLRCLIITLFKASVNKFIIFILLIG